MHFPLKNCDFSLETYLIFCCLCFVLELLLCRKFTCRSKEQTKNNGILDKPSRQGPPNCNLEGKEEDPKHISEEIALEVDIVLIDQ